MYARSMGTVITTADDWIYSWTLGIKVFLGDSALGSQLWMKDEEINYLVEELGGVLCASWGRGDSLGSLR